MTPISQSKLVRKPQRSESAEEKSRKLGLKTAVVGMQIIVRFTNVKKTVLVPEKNLDDAEPSGIKRRSS